MARLMWSGYGKAGVRLVRVERSGPRHDLHDLAVDIQLQGDFDAAHVSGDNTRVLPTDTMRNTVYAMAREQPVDPPESFGEHVGRHFLAACPAARHAVVTLTRHSWERAVVDGVPQDHAFLRGTGERRTAVVTVDAAGARVSAGLEGLGLLRTAGSAFADFLRDPYTTLAETRDRVFATDVAAAWRYTGPPADWTAAWRDIRAALIATFATHASESVQHTLYAMGDSALQACAEITEIRLLLPNRHHLLVDLAPFGLDNPNAVFVATAEPYGRIEAVVAR